MGCCRSNRPTRPQHQRTRWNSAPLGQWERAGIPLGSEEKPVDIERWDLRSVVFLWPCACPWLKPSSTDHPSTTTTREPPPAGTSESSSPVFPRAELHSHSSIVSPHFHSGHCAYVVEKTVTFTVQDGAAPYVKADYNKCSWGHKCPTLLCVHRRSSPLTPRPLIPHS